jgi:hypothetical protein
MQLDVQQYREQGYTVARGLIPTAELLRIRMRLMDLLEGGHSWPPDHFQVLDPARFRNSKGGPVPVGVQRPSRCEQVFRDIAEHARLEQAMAQLLGGPVELFTDQALIKGPQISGQSFYHQDSYYWKIAPERGCNAWIALDKVGTEASALAIMPGSQKDWNLTAHEAYYDTPTFHNAKSGEAFTRWRIPLTSIDFSGEALLTMEPGDAAFFTNYTWHRSEPNNSGTHKCAYAIAYKLKDR